MEIFDAYVEDLMRQDKAKDKKQGSKSTMSVDEEQKNKPVQSELQSDDITRVSNAAMVMERMVNQNTFDDIAQGIARSNSYVSQLLFINDCAWAEQRSNGFQWR